MKSKVWIARAAILLVIGLRANAAVLPVSVAGTAFGQASGGSADSIAPIMSADGRYVLFASQSQNLTVSSQGVPIPDLYAGKINVYLRDRTNGTTTLVSVNLAGTDGANGDSFPTAISTNGQFALFESTATNLVTNALSGTSQVFRRDLVTQRTILISGPESGAAPNGVARSPVMTPDGRYAAFVSAATNLVTQDTNGIPDVFVHDTQTGTMTLVSSNAVSNSAVTTGSSSELPAISTDGRYVAFYTTATNLIAGVTNTGEIFLKDLVGGTMAWASIGSHAAVYAVSGSSNALSCNLALTDDGQYVAYEACALTNGASSSLLGGVVLQYSLATGLTDVVNTNALGILSGNELNNRNLDMTPDGRFLAFVANVGTTYGTTCVDVWDSQSNVTTVASVDASGAIPSGQQCNWPAMDATGRYVAFYANSPSLAPGAPNGPALYLRDQQAAATQWIDVNTYGSNSPENMMTFPRLDTNGDSVAFESLGEGLVANDNNHVYNVFVRNISDGSTELISARLPSLPALTANGPSLLAPNCISTNCRYVAFASEADNIVAGDANGYRNVFVRDVLSGTNYLVSGPTNGTLANGPSYQPAISGNGRYVAFTSSATNLVAGDTNNVTDVFLTDLEAGTTSLVSVYFNGTGPGNAPSSAPQISDDGSYVLFRSRTSTTGSNYFWRDLPAEATIELSTGSDSAAAMTPDGRTVAFISGNLIQLWSADLCQITYSMSTSFTPLPIIAVSPNGRRIFYALSTGVYAIDAGTNILLGITPTGTHLAAQFSADSRFLVYMARPLGSNQVYLHDFQTGSNILVSQSYASTNSADGDSDSPTISGDGQFVAYRSFADNLVPGDTNGVPDIFLYDRLTGSDSLLTVDQSGNGPANNRSLTPVFTGSGETLVFTSWASDLASGDGNQWSDIFAFQPYASGTTNAQGSFVLNGPTFVTVSWQDSQQAPSFNWLTAPGVSYMVQYTDNLDDPNWQTLTNNVSVIGGQGYAIDLEAAAAQRFYRIVGAQ
jgi:hypothetical protein